jgi:hypothetical protein
MDKNVNNDNCNMAVRSNATKRLAVLSVSCGVKTKTQSGRRTKNEKKNRESSFRGLLQFFGALSDGMWKFGFDIIFISSAILKCAGCERRFKRS